MLLKVKYPQKFDWRPGVRIIPAGAIGVLSAEATLLLLHYCDSEQSRGIQLTPEQALAEYGFANAVEWATQELIHKGWLIPIEVSPNDY